MIAPPTVVERLAVALERIAEATEDIRDTLRVSGVAERAEADMIEEAELDDVRAQQFRAPDSLPASRGVGAALALRVHARLNGLPSEGWSGRDDLRLAELILEVGCGLDAAAEIMERARDDVARRWAALLPVPSREAKATLLRVLRERGAPA